AGVLAINRARNFFPDRNSGNRKQTAPSKIRLKKNSDGETLRWFIFSRFDVDLPRRRSAAAFEFVTNHSRSAADASLLDRAAVRGIERVKDVVSFDMKSVGVVEKTVPGFGDERQAPPRTARIRRAVFDPPLNHRIPRHADAVRVR